MIKYMSETGPVGGDLGPDAHVAGNPAKLSMLDSLKVRVGMVLAGGTLGAVEGAAYANYVNPPDIRFAQGLEGETSLTFHDGADISSPVGSLNVPNAPLDIHAPAVDGIHATINVLQPGISDPQAMGEYVGLVSNFNDSVAEPITHSIVSSLAVGAGVGGAVGAGLTYGALRYLKHTRTKEAGAIEDIEAQMELETEAGRTSAERQQKNLRIEKIGRKVVATTLSVVALTGFAYTAKSVRDVESAANQTGVPVSPYVVSLVPELDEATVSDGSGEQINALALVINNLKEDADQAWQTGYQNMVPAIDEYFANEGKKFVDNPNIVAVAHVSDIHCNLSNYKNYFGKILSRLNPDIVADTGDTQTNSGTMFYETDCVPNLEEAVKQSGIDNDKSVTLVKIAGNHDALDAVSDAPGVVNLGGDGGKAEIADVPLPEVHGTKHFITFAGAPDLVRTEWSNSPEDITDQQQLQARQGHDIAELACHEQEKGKTVITMSHEGAGNDEAIYEGCTDLALDGHTHIQQPTFAYRGWNGKTVLQHTEGSASGTDTKVSLYEAPERDATMSVFYYDRAQDKFVGYVTIALHIDGTTSVNYNDLSNPPKNPDHVDTIRDFLQTYPPGDTLGNNAAAHNDFAVVNNG